MSNSYENEINELVDGIMKVAEEATASTGMEKEAGIFNRKKKSELSANKAKANEMFSGQGGDDSASDPKGKVQRKWKRIKAKFFKRANENTEEMIEKIAAAAGTEVDMLLDYIEKIAAEEDLDGQDIVDTLYEDIEDVEDEEEYDEEEYDEEEYGEEEYDDEEYEDEEYEDEDEDEEYGEEVEASMINEAMEKIAAVAGMDEETVADYIVAVASENEIDELEVLAALEDEADEVLEKEAGIKDSIKAGGRKALDAIDRFDDRFGNKVYGEETYQPAKSNMKRMGELAKSLKKGEGSLEEYRDAVEKYKEFNDLMYDKGRKFSRIPAAVMGATLGGVAGHSTGSKRKAALGATIGGLGFAGLNELSGLAEKRSSGKGIDHGARYVEKKYNRAVAKREAAEKQAFEVLVDEAIEKVAYVAGVDSEDVVDYVEKLAYENDLDEIEVLAELEKEAKFVGTADERKAYNDMVGSITPTKVKGFKGNLRERAAQARMRAELFGMDHPNFQKANDFVTNKASQAGDFAKKHSKGLKIGGGIAGTAALAGAGYAGYRHLQKRKAQAETEKAAFEALVDEAIEKVAYVAGVDSEDVIDYVEKLAYENDLDEIEVLAELEKEAAPKFMDGLADKVRNSKPAQFAGKHSKALKIGGGITGAAALSGAGYAGYRHLQKRKARRAAESEE